MKTCTTCGSQWPDDTQFCPRDGSPLRAEGPSLVGNILAGRYHILEKIGEGGMGAVYAGEHVKMRRKSAIKVLTESLSQDTEAIARFNREAANAASINHVNVCGIYDFGETDDGLIYLAMEFIEGETLTEVLRQEGPLGPYRAAVIIHQTASALQAAHDLGIVHRDLKPDNIMIAKTRDGSDLVKVVDFGIAKAMGGDEGQKVTRTGLVVGTPEYMSPEQLSGDVMDGRSDIYSLALVLFRMLTGRLPFEAESAQEIMVKRLTDEPLRLNQALPGANFPPKLQDVIDRALQRMPGDRYAGAEDFARDVFEAVSGGTYEEAMSRQGATKMMDSAPGAPGVTEQLKKTRISGSKPTVPLEHRRRRDQRSTTPETPLPLTRPHSPTGRRKPVVMIAASVVVVAVAAGAVGVALSGGEDTPPTGQLDASRTPESIPPVTAGTAEDSGQGEIIGSQVPETGALPSESTEVERQPVTQDTPRGIDDPGTEPRQPPGSVIDSAALDGQILSWWEQIDAAAGSERRRLMSEAEDWFNNQRVPQNLRADAAAVIARGHWLNDVTGEACTWIVRALTLQPNRRGFQEMRSAWGCTP